MKAYIFFTLNLCAMHGANMYIYNKINYLKENGYRVFLYSGEQGKATIPGLREFEKDQIPELRFYPACFSKKKVTVILDKMCSEIAAAGCSEYLVESTNLYSALWGELLAEKLGCRHLVFVLQENFSYSAAERAFLRFKLDRHELAGIVKASVGKMLKDETIPFDDSMKIIAYCNNTIDTCEDTISPQLDPEAAMTVCSIGRLEKGYVLPLVGELAAIAGRHPDTVYNIVLIGGTRARKQIRKIKAAFSDLKNVKLIMTGAMFPIPGAFADRCDVFVSAAGSAAASYSWGRPTIRINPKTGDIIDCMGLQKNDQQTTKRDIYSANYPLSELEDLIRFTMENRDNIEYTVDRELFRKRMAAEFDRQLQYPSLCPTSAYYDTRKIRFERRAYRPFNVLGKVVDARLLYRGLELARIVFK